MDLIPWVQHPRVGFHPLLKAAYLERGESSTGLISDLLSAVDEVGNENPNILKFESKFAAQLSQLAQADQGSDAGGRMHGTGEYSISDLAEVFAVSMSV